MRVLIFHGYLLRGTGSNIYNASLARALARLGHEVHLLCQDRDLATPPEGVHGPHAGHRPGPAGLRGRQYEGFDAKPFPELSDEELEHYLEQRSGGARTPQTPDVALANHLVMGPAILARGLAGRVPYAVKIHGSALEYTVRPNRERFLPYALEGLRGRRRRAGGLAPHRREPLGGAGRRAGAARAHPARPARGGRAHLPAAAPSAASSGSPAALGVGRHGRRWGGEAGAAEALRALDPARDRIVGYVGKLIVSKGVDLLLAAWPLVVAARARGAAVLVGFGTYREALGRLVEALARARPGRPARDRRARPRARGRAARRAELPGAVPRRARASDWLRRRARRPPSGCTSPAASSTTTCPTCCPPARRR